MQYDKSENVLKFKITPASVSFETVTFYSFLCGLIKHNGVLQKNFLHKKVLRERKRHTVCRIASARFANGGGGGTLSSLGLGGVPGVSPLSQVWWGGTPSSLGQGGTPFCWLGGGIPSSLGTGSYPKVPPIPGLDLGWDTPPHPDLGWGTPPSTSVDRLKLLPSLIIRMRAVIITFFEGNYWAKVIMIWHLYDM